MCNTKSTRIQGGEPWGQRLGDVLQRADLETVEISRPHDSDFTICSR